MRQIKYIRQATKSPLRFLHFACIEDVHIVNIKQVPKELNMEQGKIKRRKMSNIQVGRQDPRFPIHKSYSHRSNRVKMLFELIKGIDNKISIVNPKCQAQAALPHSQSTGGLTRCLLRDLQCMGKVNGETESKRTKDTDKNLGCSETKPEIIENDTTMDTSNTWKT